ncbi:MAG: hypothetical protein HQL11_00195 [Candidatus Omnitrophica bacterium]|nr:hypothetical protein [Candidatus Omnitrophota bacterium]
MFKTLNKLTIFLVISVVAGGILLVTRHVREIENLKKIQANLTADSRAAEVLVTGVRYDDRSRRRLTRIKFLEYDIHGRPLEPRYFEFMGNLIQFQSLVVRFEDESVMKGDSLKGKSIYLFLKAFVLDGAETQEFEITAADSIPAGYRVSGVPEGFQKKIWEEFWEVALDPQKRLTAGIKSAQIEAPGSLFVPGTLYSIRIEHDGGLRIDTRPIPPILKGESIPVAANQDENS